MGILVYIWNTARHGLAYVVIVLFKALMLHEKKRLPEGSAKVLQLIYAV